MLDKIREIIADLTHNSPASVSSKSSSQNLEGWDSVAQINIIVAVEQEFGVAFSAEEMHSLNSVEAIMQSLTAQAEPR